LGINIELGQEFERIAHAYSNIIKDIQTSFAVEQGICFPNIYSKDIWKSLFLH